MGPRSMLEAVDSRQVFAGVITSIILSSGSTEPIVSLALNSWRPRSVRANLETQASSRRKWRRSLSLPGSEGGNGRWRNESKIHDAPFAGFGLSRTHRLAAGAGTKPRL
jgi:hypothetical protein